MWRNPGRSSALYHSSPRTLRGLYPVSRYHWVNTAVSQAEPLKRDVECCIWWMAGATGLEPATSGVTGRTIRQNTVLNHYLVTLQEYRNGQQITQSVTGVSFGGLCES